MPSETRRMRCFLKLCRFYSNTSSVFRLRRNPASPQGEAFLNLSDARICPVKIAQFTGELHFGVI
ncbi:MAG: hypothetical protein IKZ06_02710, partial [Oscillospiraceae bacterium]|nr:hypothetical protein [Oscillospiraceae bacterium]